MRVIGVLEVLGAAEMIVMAVRKDDIFHLRRIEAQLFVAANNDALGFLCIIESVDLDDAAASHQRPRGHDIRSQVIKLIEDLGGGSHDWFTRRGSTLGPHTTVNEIS